VDRTLATDGPGLHDRRRRRLPTVTLPLLVTSVVALVALSAFFSSSESAIFSLPEEWVREAAAERSPESAALGPVVVLFDASTRRLTAFVGGDQGIEENLLDE
jgi:Mg2+/Co2+ transporter CorB